MINQIEEGIENGIYSIKNVRFSDGIGVTDIRFNNGEAINCRIISDDIYDNNGKLILNVERHIGISSKYYTEEVYKLPEWLLLYTNS